MKIAFALWYDGWASKSVSEIKQMRNIKRSVDEKGKIRDGDKTLKVWTRDIPSYFTDDFWTCLFIWRRFKLLGNPFNTGWLDWPWWISEGIDVFESTYNEVNYD